MRRSNILVHGSTAILFGFGTQSWSSGGTTELQVKNFIVKNLAPPPPPPICTGFEMIPLALKASWIDAKKACRSLGAELAFFHTEVSKISNKAYYLGLLVNIYFLLYLYVTFFSEVYLQTFFQQIYFPGRV